MSEFEESDDDDSFMNEREEECEDSRACNLG